MNKRYTAIVAIAVVVIVVLSGITALFSLSRFHKSGERSVQITVAGTITNNSTGFVYDGIISFEKDPDVGDRFVGVRVVFLDKNRSVISKKSIGTLEATKGHRPVFNFSASLTEKPSLVLIQFKKADTNAAVRVEGSIQKPDNLSVSYPENESEYLYSD